MPLIDVTKEDFADEGLQYVIGVSPCQIDFLTSLPGAPPFEEAWDQRSIGKEGTLPIPHLGKADLITAKQIAGRLQDLADIEELRRADS